MRIELRGFKCDLTLEEEADLREQLEGRPQSISPNTSEPEVIDAATLAKKLGVSREYIYDHAEELGGEKLGEGPRGRWRFPAERPEISRHQEAVARPDPRTRPRARRSTANVTLLAVRGDAPYAGPKQKRPPAGAVTPTESLDKEV
jgi:hypothetical protein